MSKRKLPEEIQNSIFDYLSKREEIPEMQYGLDIFLQSLSRELNYKVKNHLYY
jgi:hypothetical protein